MVWERREVYERKKERANSKAKCSRCFKIAMCRRVRACVAVSLRVHARACATAERAADNIVLTFDTRKMISSNLQYYLSTKKNQSLEGGGNGAVGGFERKD